jgi:hypothetical protein
LDESFSRIVIYKEWSLHFASVIASIACVALAVFPFGIAAITRPTAVAWIGSGLMLALGAYVRWRDIRGRNKWDQLSYLELQDGRITLVPSRRMSLLGYEKAQAPFPVGSRLECHIDTGDMYFTGDHGSFIKGSLWIVEPTGTKQKLFDYWADVCHRVMAANLRNAGIPFRIINFYSGQDGEHTETDITSRFTEGAPKPRNRKLLTILLGTSNLWLGAVAGALVHNSGYVIAIGVSWYVVMASVQLLSVRSSPGPSKRSALVQVGTSIPLFAAGYAFSVVCVWYIFK